MNRQQNKKIDETAYIIKSTYCQCPGYNQIIPDIIERGVEILSEKIQMTSGIPISEVLERFDGIEFAFE